MSQRNLTNNRSNRNSFTLPFCALIDHCTKMISIPYLFFLCCIILVPATTALDNGLALTPPMGWLSWARFYCQIDCLRHPITCISEDLYREMADLLVSEGYAEVGYTLVNIDDCWPSNKRDANERLQANSTRFPHGIKWLAEYMHNKGLRLGIYEDYGTKTCAGYPGSLNYLETDAKTFANWTVDMVKLDGCNANAATMSTGYPLMSKLLNDTNHRMIFSCEWPLYEIVAGIKPNYTHIAEKCNLWRNHNDVNSNWQSISDIINWYDHHQDELIPAHGPGHWNDPDMIVVGNPGLTVDQAKAQFAIWSIWSAPLLMSNDLRFMAPANKAILTNRKIIAVDQDPNGIMGRLIINCTSVGVYVKPVEPKHAVTKDWSYAIAFLNRHLKLGTEATVKLQTIGLNSSAGYFVEDLYTDQQLGLKKAADKITVRIKSTGVVMLKATVANT